MVWEAWRTLVTQALGKSNFSEEVKIGSRLDWVRGMEGEEADRVGLYCCSFNLFAEYIMWNASLDEAQTGIKIARRNINRLR